MHSRFTKFVVFVRVFYADDGASSRGGRQSYEFVDGGYRSHELIATWTVRLVSQGAGYLVLRQYGSNNHVVAFLQVAFQDGAHLGIGVVRNSKRNLYRLH